MKLPINPLKLFSAVTVNMSLFGFAVHENTRLNRIAKTYPMIPQPVVGPMKPAQNNAASNVPLPAKRPR